MAVKNHSRSKKISELSSWSTLPIHQSHTWLPAAQYDSRVHSYTNIAINVDAITTYSANVAFTYSMDKLAYAIDYIDLNISYTADYAYAYTSDRYYDVIDKIATLTSTVDGQLDAITDLYKLKAEWTSFSNVAKGNNYEEVSYYVNKDPVAKSIVSYTFAYTMNTLDWQKINGAQPWITNSTVIN